MREVTKKSTFSITWYDFLVNLLLLPIRLYAHPNVLIKEAKKAYRGWIGFFCTLLSGLLWGGGCGLFLWYTTGELQGFFAGVLSITLILIGAFSKISTKQHIFLPILIMTVGIATIAAFLNAFIVAGAITFTFIGLIATAFSDSDIESNSITHFLYLLYASIIISVAANLSIEVVRFLFLSITFLFTFFSFILVIIFSFNLSFNGIFDKNFWGKNYLLYLYYFSYSLYLLIWLVLLPIAGFFYFPFASVTQTPIYAFVIVLSLFAAGISGILGNNQTIRSKHKLITKLKIEKAYLKYFWSTSLILGSVAWGVSPDNQQLDQNLEILAYFLFALVPIATGLFLYPVMAFLHWQQAKKVHFLDIRHLWVMRWQTFAYPLPFFDLFFKNYQQQYGTPATIQLIKTLQFNTFQIKSITDEVSHLAQHPHHAFEFCGHIAISSNIYSTVSLSQATDAGKIVASLIKRDKKKEEKQILSIYIPPLSENSSLQNKHIIGEIKAIRNNILSKRVNYALTILGRCKNFTSYDDLHTLLTTLQQMSSIKNVEELFALKIAIPTNSPDWIAPIWLYINELCQVIEALREIYPTLNSEKAHHQFIEQQHKILQNLTCSKQPEYWRNIAKELQQHWCEVLTK